MFCNQRQVIYPYIREDSPAAPLQESGASHQTECLLGKRAIVIGTFLRNTVEILHTLY